MNENNMGYITRKYQFLRTGRGISLNSNGQIGTFFFHSQLADDTLGKMAEGLNHFLEYFYHTDNDKYEKIGRWLFTKILFINQDIKNLLLNDMEHYNINRKFLIDKYLLPDQFILDYICEYVAHCSKENIDESEATTEITLRNVDCAVLHALSVVIKFVYVLVTHIRGDKKFDDILLEYADTIMYNVIKTSEHYFDYSAEGFDAEAEHSHIINVMYEFYRRDWAKQNTSFQLKFEEVGKDSVKLGLDAMAKVLSSLKKYVPSLIDLNNPVYKTSEDVDMRKVYWTIDKDWTEFALVNLNMTGYLRVTTKKILTRQDAKATVANVNLPDFIQDVGSDDSFIHKEHALYYDKKKFMYESSKKNTITLFRNVVLAIDKLDKEKPIDIKILQHFSLAKDHILNRFILNKILLALTGDCRIFVDQLGVFAKFVLLLFYERIMRDTELDFLHSIAQCMIMNPTVGTCMYTDKDIEETIAKFSLGDVTAETFKTLIPVYVQGDHSICPGIMDMIDFYVFMSDPSRIRNLMYPDRYEVKEETKTHQVRDREANKWEAPLLNKIMEDIANGYKTSS